MGSSVKGSAKKRLNESVDSASSKNSRSKSKAKVGLNRQPSGTITPQRLSEVGLNQNIEDMITKQGDSLNISVP